MSDLTDSLAPTTETFAPILETQIVTYRFNRQFNGFPTASAHVRSLTGDPLLGNGTPTLTPVLEGFECDYSPATVEEIASSQGLLQTGDVRLVTYSLGEEVSHETIFTLSGGRTYKIISQLFISHMGRSEFMLRPYS